MTTEDYQSKFPDAPFHHEDHYGSQFTEKAEKSRLLKRTAYVAPDGEVRDKDTGRKVEPSKALTTYPKNITDIEKYVRSLVGYNCEDMFVVLKAIAIDKKVTIGSRLKAIEMILAYGLGRPMQRKQVDSTIKKLEVSISGTLPEGYSSEDF